MKVGLWNRKRWRQVESQCGFDRKTWGKNWTRESALFSCPHRGILEPTEFRNKIWLKTWLLFVNQTCVKSVSPFVVTQINIITTEHNMLVVWDRVSCSCLICTMKPRMTLKFWSFCCHLLSTGDRCASTPSLCGARNGVWGVLCVLNKLLYITQQITLWGELHLGLSFYYSFEYCGNIITSFLQCVSTLSSVLWQDNETHYEQFCITAGQLTAIPSQTYKGNYSYPHLDR